MGSDLLVVAGLLALAVALFHVVLAFSPSLCRTFGAPEALLARGPVVVAVVTLLVVLVFATWGLYAFSAAGWLPRLPLLFPAIIGIGGIFTARGLVVFFQLLIRAGVIRSRRPVSRLDVFSSTVSLLIGMVYLAGILASWEVLARPSP